MRKKGLFMHIAFVACFLFFSEFTHHLYGQIHEGEKINLWTPTSIDYEPLINEPQYLIEAICKKVGKHCYILFNNKATLPSQSLIDSLANVFDNTYYPELTKAFGPVPNEFDNDSCVLILFLDTVKWGAFFDPGQLMSDTMIFNRWQKHSSEREIIYVNSNIFDYGAKYFSNIAHEFIHMLTWNYDYSPEPVNNPEIYWEQTWINEAWANFGTSYFNYDIISFGPEITYVNYPEISFFNYVLSENLLFFYYLFDNYGEWDFNSALLENQLNGMEGVESTLNGLGYNKTFDDFFEDFSIAEYINDTNYADGLFSYKSINVTSCFKSKETGCSMAMLGDYEGQLASYAKDYFLFDLQVQDPFPIQFKGDENSKFRLAFIMANKDKKIVEIKSIMPDDANNAIVTKDLMTEECDILIMIVINADRSLKDDELVSFSYNTPESTTIYDKTTYGEVSVYPNPVLQDLTIYLAGRYSHASFELFNMQGRKILSKTIIKSEKIDLQALNNGIFFYNVFTDKKIQCGKLIKQ